MAYGQVVREIQNSRSGVTVKTEDGSIYEASYVVLSVSIGVLQSDLISFRPPLPVRIPSILVYMFTILHTLYCTLIFMHMYSMYCTLVNHRMCYVVIHVFS